MDLRHVDEKIGNGDFGMEVPGWLGLGVMVRVYGGPFRKRPHGMPSVCLRAEATPGEVASADVYVPIKDFGVPDREDMEPALVDAFDLLLKHGQLYVGCLGGWGRTGLFLACMMKVIEHKFPVSYVRAMYASNAVETREQEQFVWDLDVRHVRRSVRWAATKTAVLKALGLG